jgi:hypothetical protein
MSTVEHASQPSVAVVSPDDATETAIRTEHPGTPGIRGPSKDRRRGKRPEESDPRPRHNDTTDGDEDPRRHHQDDHRSTGPL